MNQQSNRVLGACLLLAELFFLSFGNLAFAEGERPVGPTAKNVILFLGDAGGIPTLNAASLYKYDKPQQLFIQHMQYIGLMDTSASNAWVADSASGMSAIVTGVKTANGVLSESPDAAGGDKDGRVRETILEYAEEHGLSTGVISNMSMVDATPAACYAHVDDRSKAGEIFSQLFAPRFGDGVDLMIGAGRQQITYAMQKRGIDWTVAAKQKGYAVATTPEGIPSDAHRLVALFDSGRFDLPAIVRHAIEILSQNPKGYFLMVECDMHADNVRAGLDHVITMDQMIRATFDQVSANTLILFTADHSFDLRLHGGRPGQPLLPAVEETNAREPTRKASPLRMDESHTGEEVLVAAQGPGAQLVNGFFPNTRLFRIMMAAYGWEPEPAGN